MKRKDIQHIKIEKAEGKSQKAEVETDNRQLTTDNFLTAEGIELKPTYSHEDIENLEHVGFGAGFAPNLRGPYGTMYVPTG